MLRNLGKGPISLLLILILMSWCSATFAGGDRTDEFREIFQGSDGQKEIEVQKKLGQSLQQYKIIFVAGFMSDLYRNLGKQNFKEHTQWLEKEMGLKRGVDFDIAPINSYATSKENMPVLRDLIEGSSKDIILVGHSKGGLDILNTLIHRPELRKKIKGVLTLQTPFFGSPVADYFKEHPWLGALVHTFLHAMGGNKKSLLDLSTEKGKKVMSKYQGTIEELLRDIPFLSLVTYFPSDVQVPFHCNLQGMFSTVISPFRRYMNALGLGNDSMVTREGQMLPGADYVTVEGIDHLGAVMDSAFEVDKIRLFKSLLYLLFTKNEKK